ncbi:thiamine pyrophosphate-dependent enzyme [Notoacmeibacter sp. MSK16QG-6]|uniref:thiamine pyrophosphate-dependent enzyme n=1 Tax=Notoacmeibacter sp. MSK16QG-6 TaxID=2957982 RepID=UPI0020A1BAAE|nr:thiamine pyrophosphate-dependent enzyme [Notoacmeibacter sp. MSK16QG-6]MCP1199168.1 thiamine pyrophosphate-dependent enzyme [Notoacmeibacter sp. MSK16QG-6]
MVNNPSQKDAIGQVLAAFEGARPLCVADIGSQSGWLHQADNDPRNLYLSGPMGQAPSVALGVALARPDDDVVAFCGDGALAMNLTALVTIADQAPKNLTVVLLDNDVYEYTKAVPTPSRALDWKALGASCFGPARSFDSVEAFAKRDGQGPFFLALKIDAGGALPPGTGLTPEQIKARFAEALAIT